MRAGAQTFPSVMICDEAGDTSSQSEAETLFQPKHTAVGKRHILGIPHCCLIILVPPSRWAAFAKKMAPNAGGCFTLLAREAAPGTTRAPASSSPLP